ncbi:MAG: hypothetical protein JW841_07930 [Deltaproteobacteria bacterium]|nr:hypothetical protein [Deltaproteobacteria bacterium]
MRRWLSIIITGFLTNSCGYGIVDPVENYEVRQFYNATASNGDFLRLEVNYTSKHIEYQNLSRAQSSSIDYTISANGSYELLDKEQLLKSAYEIPDKTLIIETSDPSLIIAIVQSPIQIADLANHELNYLQFNEDNGGIQLGHITIDDNANLQINSYFPAGPLLGTPSAFGISNIPNEILSEKTTMNTIEDALSSSIILFGDPNGTLIMKTNNSSTIAWPTSDNTTFNTEYAGKYKTYFYTKISQYVDGHELGNANIKHVDTEVSTSGHLLITGENGVLIDVDLIPLQSAENLYDAEALTSPCAGLFVAQIPGSSAETYVLFMNDIIAFAHFQNISGSNETSIQYHYIYGLGVRETVLALKY